VDVRDSEPASLTFEDTTAFTSAATFHPFPERRIRLLMIFLGLTALLGSPWMGRRKGVVRFRIVLFLPDPR
jgi:hypothetical protein